MAKSGKMERKRKRKRKNTTSNSQVEPELEPQRITTVIPVLGAGKNRTIAACSRNRNRDDKYKYSLQNNSSIIDIPREIMYHILLLLPASLLQEIVRFVCKDWNSIITDPFFIRAHLLHSSATTTGPAFLIQDQDVYDAKLKRAFYLHSYGHAHTTTKHKLPFNATILGSCNRLLLLQKPKHPQKLFLVNPVTKAHITLPPVTLLVHCKSPSIALAFTSSSGQYKVVYVSDRYLSKNEHGARFEQVKVMLCTIGVDKTWRTIDYQGITMSFDAKETLMSRPFSSAGGHICWFHECHDYGIALDIDAETMYQFAGPMYQFAGPVDYFVRACNNKPTHSVPMDTGGVCMVYSQFPARCWKILELIDPKTDTWGSCINFDAAVMYSAIDRHFSPRFVARTRPLLISFKTGELWLYCSFRSSNDINFSLVCYNWKTDSFWASPIKSPRCLGLAIPYVHVNSLLSPKNL